ncbi:Hypothetical protein MSYG_3112 [Malassezia sympodialis ATCC 42132]|uniref:N-end rule aminoacyl transferase C-terminal domain-containing protein n=1 Tax=Malassezia sympodialis (strain ATCC 42132) TaxID=1230383 RepID=A0A1M8A993_MALS4|nr:Hypothetical protein MSYG_3112 [Malassezia sympodialis ATCC 42132]
MVTTIRWYYLGFYIYSCPKMRYKGEFRPCDLLDTSDNSWHALDHVLPRLRAGQRAYFDATRPPLPAPLPPPSSLPREMSVDEDLPRPLPLGFTPLESVRAKSDECAVLDTSVLPPVLRSLKVLLMRSPRLIDPSLATLDDDQSSRQLLSFFAAVSLRLHQSFVALV